MSIAGRLGRLAGARRESGEQRAGDEAHAQRREAVRTGGSSDLHVGRKGYPMVRCLALDYSGSGLRAVLPPPQLAVGEQVDLYVRLPDGVGVEASAEVVRNEGHGVCAFRFVGLDSYQREVLIGHVFAEQRRALAATKAAR